MTAPDTPPGYPNEDGRLSRVLDDFLAAFERGEAPDRSALIAAHPDLAADLSNCLASLEFLGQAAPSEAYEQGARCLGDLGDFRLIREIGRGGMGVVYEAEERALGRRVALKVLPFASMLDPRHLRRFKIEAQAAAQLHHANIVPVFGIGCEHGIHFFIMQLVDGQSLAETIRTTRRLAGRDLPADGGSRGQKQGSGAPTAETSSSGGVGPEVLSPLGHGPAYFLTVARLFVQAAEALGHAHEWGVVHRDIKPANLLIDGRGQLWVTDFGLARMHDEPGLTASGDVLGTLRYMSPEQASAAPGGVDARSDVYSLGVTLYEMLTLEPAFPGEDRFELSRRVIEDEPCPPRRIERSIPKDLETVCLKAMRKEPAERYGTSQELADDLRRFLEIRPIRARRLAAWSGASKWVRRHPTAIGLAVALLSTTVVALATSWVLVARERDEARRQGRRAEASLLTARDVVDRMLTHAAEELKDIPHAEKIRQRLLEDALTFYKGLLGREGRDPETRHETALAYRRIGLIHEKLGRFDAAGVAFGEAIALLACIAEESPGTVHLESELATCHGLLAGAYSWLHRARDAVDELRTELAMVEKIAAGHPDDPGSWEKLSQIYTNLGIHLCRDVGSYREAEECHRRAMRIWEIFPARFPGRTANTRLRARAHHWLGSFLMDTARYAEAEVEFRTGLGLRERHVAERPDSPEDRSDLEHIRGYMASVMLATGRPIEAERYCRLAILEMERLMAEFPEDVEYPRRLGWDLDRLSNALGAQGRYPEAEESLRRVLDLRRKSALRSPNAGTHREGLAYARYRLGMLLRANGKATAGMELLHQSRDDYLAMAPEHASLPSLLAKASLILTGFPDPVLREPDRAARLARRAVALAPELAYAWLALGAAEYRAGRWDESIRSLEKALQVRPGMTGHEQLLLAMACARRGDDRQAGDWFERGRGLAKLQAKYDFGLRLWLDEASEILDPPVRGVSRQIVEPAVGLAKFAGEGLPVGTAAGDPIQERSNPAARLK